MNTCFKLIETFSIKDATINVYRTELNDGKRTQAIFGKHKDFMGDLVVEKETYDRFGGFSSSQWEKCIAIN